MKHIPVISSKKYHSALHLCNEINASKSKLPVRVQCGESQFILREDNFRDVYLGCLMAASWKEES